MFIAVVTLVTLAIAAVAAAIDHRKGQIPNWLTLPALALAPLAYYQVYGVDGLTFSAIGLLACGLLPYLMFRADAIGGGDVKLFAALGALNGVALGGEMLVLAFALGCAQALLYLVWRRQLGRVLRNSGRILVNAVLPVSKRKPIPTESLTELRLGPAIFAAVAWVSLV